MGDSWEDWDADDFEPELPGGVSANAASVDKNKFADEDVEGKTVVPGWVANVPKSQDVSSPLFVHLEKGVQPPMKLIESIVATVNRQPYSHSLGVIDLPPPHSPTPPHPTPPHPTHTPFLPLISPCMQPKKQAAVPKYDETRGLARLDLGEPLDDPEAERLRQRRLVEEADFAAAQELFGGSSEWSARAWLLLVGRGMGGMGAGQRPTVRTPPSHSPAL
jgi:hypothetical protein